MAVWKVHVLGSVFESVARQGLLYRPQTTLLLGPKHRVSFTSRTVTPLGRTVSSEVDPGSDYSEPSRPLPIASCRSAPRRSTPSLVTRSFSLTRRSEFLGRPSEFLGQGGRGCPTLSRRTPWRRKRDVTAASAQGRRPCRSSHRPVFDSATQVNKFPSSTRLNAPASVRSMSSSLMRALDNSFLDTPCGAATAAMRSNCPPRQRSGGWWFP